MRKQKRHRAKGYDPRHPNERIQQDLVIVDAADHHHDGQNRQTIVQEPASKKVPVFRDAEAHQEQQGNEQQPQDLLPRHPPEDGLYVAHQQQKEDDLAGLGNDGVIDLRQRLQISGGICDEQQQHHRGYDQGQAERIVPSAVFPKGIPILFQLALRHDLFCLIFTYILKYS